MSHVERKILRIGEFSSQMSQKAVNCIYSIGIEIREFRSRTGYNLPVNLKDH